MVVCLALMTLPGNLLAGGARCAGYVVHEWGTFTAVAGVDGAAIGWRPLEAATDLPEFVYDVSQPGIRALGERALDKSGRVGTVRMETPVLYFYSDFEQVVSARVGFASGQVTEWYPHARAVDDGGIDWGQLRVLAPTESPDLPQDGSDSHYYPARNVDANALRLGDAEGFEYERFLFYRGVGDFDLSVAARIEGDAIHMAAPNGASSEAIVFESRGGRVGFTSVTVGEDGVIVTRPSLTGTVDGVVEELERRLVADGLYEREARAMTDTWRTDWFEDGLRVFWLMPREETDTILPLTLDPPPRQLVRTMVGRVELITPETEDAVRRSLLGSGTLSEATIAAGAQGRFIEPVLRRLAGGTDAAAAAARALLPEPMDG